MLDSFSQSVFVKRLILHCPDFEPFFFLFFFSLYPR